MSKTYLIRTEARGTSGDLAPGLAARIADPLWLLGRQWQFGELLGEDTGSPVSVELAAEAAQVSRFVRADQKSGTAYDPIALPLDALAGDPIRGQKSWTARMRVDAGREFVRALAEAKAGAYADAYRAEFAIAPADDDLRASDPAGARLLDVAAGRIPDGGAIYAAIAAAVRGGKDLPEPPTIDGQDLDAVRTAAEAWVAWCDETLTDTGPSTWDDERLGHYFGVATATGAGATMLDAEDFGGTAPEWHSFDVRPNASPTGFTALPTSTTLPTGVQFRGMPNPRWWELEDASVDMGAVDAGPSDVARMAMLEFALVYANDFFAVPLRLAVGSLCRITSLLVNDTFGVQLRVRSAADSTQGADRWSMFTLTEREPGAPAAGVSDLLFLAPVAGQPITSEPVEEVLLLRDEMANLAWAVERRYEGETGAAAERIEEHTRALPDHDAPGEDATLRYRLGTTVPRHWFPLVPQVTGGEPRLRLERMANHELSVKPRGRFLSLGGPDLPDGEVPREGARLLRDYALARAASGATVVWARRTRRTGRGEGSSGLRFDAAELDRPETEA
jgi:hypothetical protein